MADQLVASEKVKIERKLFYIDLMENRQGAFLRITEDVRGRRDRIIIPATGINDFLDAIESVLEGADLPDSADDDVEEGSDDEQDDEDDPMPTSYT